jgi:hypothetical protein
MFVTANALQYVGFVGATDRRQARESYGKHSEQHAFSHTTAPRQVIRCSFTALQYAGKASDAEGNYNEDGLMMSTQPCGLMECDDGCSCSRHCKVRRRS